MKEGIEIRKLGLEGLETVLGWACSEGWNPGLQDASCFLAADPEGFLGAFSGARLQGAISAVRYGRDFSFIGLFIVRPELRGGHLGPLLGRAALERLAGVNIGVDGVEKKVPNYEASGFKLACRNIRYEGLAGVAPASSPLPIAAASQLPFEQLLDYDSRHFPASRPEFLRAWIGAQGHVGLACLDKAGGIDGYGVLRPCAKGVKIGPLFASSRAVAEALLAGLLAKAPSGSPFYLDVPEVNVEGLALAESLAMKPVFKTARMYNLRRPELPEREIFGVSSFELG